MSKEKKKKNPILKILKVILILVLIVVLLFAGLLVFLSVTEYKPADRETITVCGTAEKEIPTGKTVKIISWNVGYCALGDNADFFMDGGKMVNTASKERVEGSNPFNVIS